MLAFDLPFADAVVKPHDILSTGATALTTILLDYRHMYHDLVCIINEAEDFYEVSHDIIVVKFDDSCKGNAATFDYLLEHLVDVDAYRTLLVIKNLFQALLLVQTKSLYLISNKSWTSLIGTHVAAFGSPK
jgi:hypothetical protein